MRRGIQACKRSNVEVDAQVVIPPGLRARKTSMLMEGGARFVSGPTMQETTGG